MALERDSQNLDAVAKFLQEICNHNDINSDFVKSTILANNGALSVCLVKLVKTKSIAHEAIKVFDEVYSEIRQPCLTFIACFKNSYGKSS